MLDELIQESKLRAVDELSRRFGMLRGQRMEVHKNLKGNLISKGAYFVSSVTV